MRGIAIVFLAFSACSSAYTIEQQPISVQLPESSQQVDAEKDAVVPEASEIVQVEAVPGLEANQSKVQQLLDVDAGVSANIEATREARQFYGGFGGFGGFPDYGGFGRYPGYGGYGGYGRYPGYPGYGRYPGFGVFGGYGGFYG